MDNQKNKFTETLLQYFLCITNRAPMSPAKPHLQMKFILMILVLAVSPACAQRPATTQSAPTLAELSSGFESLAEKVSPAVVHIISSGFAPVGGDAFQVTVLGRQRSGGSGVIVGPSGYILTNAHVIAGARRVQVMLAARVEPLPGQASILKPQPKLREARIVGTDSETDLAVLKIDEADLPALPFGDFDTLRPGQLVFALGSPLGLENSVTMGIVSSVARQLERDHPMIYIQTDTAINPGNSGGPLVNAEGQVVGINTLIFSQSGGNEGIGFAAPSNIARVVFEQIRDHGYVRRGEIGVQAQTISPSLAAGLALSRDWGVLLADVKPGGPAEIGGLKVGDIVQSLDGKLMENARQFNVNIYQRAIGDVVEIKASRGSEELTANVVVLEREDDPARLAEMVTRDQNMIEKLGIMGIELNQEIRAMLPPLRRSAGVAVAARLAAGPDWSLLFQPGDVIYSVNRKLTLGLRELRQALDALPAGSAAVIQLERDRKLMYVSFELE